MTAGERNIVVGIITTCAVVVVFNLSESEFSEGVVESKRRSDKVFIAADAGRF